MKIKTTQHYPNEWTAIDEDTYDGPESIYGVGSTEAEAIADLLEGFAAVNCFDEEMWMEHKK